MHNTALDRKLYSDPVPVEVLIQALEEKEPDFQDETFDASSLFMDSSSGNMVIKKGSYNYDEHPLQDQALQLLLMKMQIPGSYANRCPTELLSENVNYFLSRYAKQLFVRFDKDEVRSILTPRYNPVSNLEMVRQIYDNIKDHGRYRVRSIFLTFLSR